MADDLISRSALLKKQTYMFDEALGTSPCVLAEDIKAAPTVDAVEVARCKECKHIENRPYGRYCTVWHGHNGMGDDGFCNYGERKTE